jgi:hypothetical protein
MNLSIRTKFIKSVNYNDITRLIALLPKKDKVKDLFMIDYILFYYNDENELSIISRHSYDYIKNDLFKKYIEDHQTIKITYEQYNIIMDDLNFFERYKPGYYINPLEYLVLHHYNPLNINYTKFVKVLIESFDFDINYIKEYNGVVYNAFILACLRKKYKLIEYFLTLSPKIYYINSIGNKMTYYYNHKVYKLLYDHIISKIKKIFAKDIIYKFLLKKVILHPQSKYIKRLVHTF